MSDFWLYLRMGFEHILDLEGVDHMVFLIALCAIYSFSQWKEILVLVTGFTIGHSVTLALATLKIFSIQSEIIEFLIPVTILLTALYNVIWAKNGSSGKKLKPNYAMAVLFGLIHGMGFSNNLRPMLELKGGSIIVPLLGFNIGIELGQLVIVAIILGIATLLIMLVGVNQKNWKLFISGAAGGIASLMILQSDFWTYIKG